MQAIEVDLLSDAVTRPISRGVRMGAMGPRTVRAVTHLDVSSPQIERALEAAVHARSEADAMTQRLCPNSPEIKKCCYVVKIPCDLLRRGRPCIW